MNTPGDDLIPYRVVYSERVRKELRLLLAQAIVRGFGPMIVVAVKNLDRMLRFFLQYGEPLADLKNIHQTLYIATLPPLVARHTIDENRRLVFVVRPLKSLPKSGF